MSNYILSPNALENIDEILIYLTENVGERFALEIEDHFFAVFKHLAEYPGLGHLRSDLANRHPVHFFLSQPYLIIYQRNTKPLVIHAILNASRNVPAILKGRII